MKLEITVRPDVDEEDVIAALTAILLAEVRELTTPSLPGRPRDTATDSDSRGGVAMEAADER